MTVTSAYTSAIYHLCPGHYAHPPAWMPPLGRVSDSRGPTHCSPLTCEGHPGDAVQPGARIVAGLGDDREPGIVRAVEGDEVEVGWDSGVITTQPISALDALEVLAADPGVA